MRKRHAQIGLITLLALGGALGASPAAAADETRLTSGACGFYRIEPNVGSLTAKYKHCAGNHIMIKFQWSNGSTSGDCVEPWGEYSFHRSGGHIVVNAYYVPTPPRLVKTSDGRLVCHPFEQPDV